MSGMRVARLNSLLKEVLADVIRNDYKNPKLSPLITVTAVEITNDLSHAKVYVSIIGKPELKKENIEILQHAAGFLAVKASKKVVMRFFPSLLFVLDETVEKQSRIEEVLKKIEKERDERQATDGDRTEL